MAIIGWQGLAWNYPNAPQYHRLISRADEGLTIPVVHEPQASRSTRELNGALIAQHSGGLPVLGQLQNRLEPVPFDREMEAAHAIFIASLGVCVAFREQELDHLTPVSEAGHVQGLVL